MGEVRVRASPSRSLRHVRRSLSVHLEEEGREEQKFRRSKHNERDFSKGVWVELKGVPECSVALAILLVGGKMKGARADASPFIQRLRLTCFGDPKEG